MTFMNRYALHALVGLNLLLALLLVLLWVGPNGRLRNLQWQPPAPQSTDYAAMLPEIPGAVPMNPGAIIAMLERPLFTTTRRPPPPPPKVADASPSDTLSTARLMGLYAGQGQGGVILHIGGKSRRLRIREQIEGWTLSAIDQRSATFSSGTTQRTLQLVKGSLANFTGQAPAAEPPPPAAPPPAVVPSPVQPEAPAPAPSAPTSPGAAKPRPQPVFGGSIR